MCIISQMDGTSIRLPDANKSTCSPPSSNNSGYTIDAALHMSDAWFSSSNVCKDMVVYNRFVDTVHRFYQAGNSQRFVATLQLVHPSNPTTALYLKFLRNDAANADVATYVDVMFDPRSLKSAEGLLTIVYQIARVSML